MKIHLAALCTLIALPASAASLVGLWEFGNPANLGEATVGDDLTVGGAHTHHASLADDGGTSLNGAVTTEGGLNSFFTAATNIAANGGGSFVNQYSFVVDLFTPAGNRGGWRAIYQTTASPSGNDGDYWIRSGDSHLGVGALTYSTSPIDETSWTRLVVTMDLALAGNDAVTYLNGSLFYTHPTDEGVDGRFSLYPISDTNVVHFFGDDTAGENPPMNVAAIALYEGALTPAEVAALGGPGGTIPEPSSALLLGLATLLGLRRRR